MISFQLTGQRLLYRFHDSLESLRIVHGKVGENFAVETDVLLGETSHELGVGETVLTGGSVDTLDPQGTELALLGLAVAVGVSETFLVGVLCNCPDILAGQEIAAGSGKNLLAACP